ncbi:hypothetical protein H4219_004397 [Mycoemilia scoparia]|uniref:G-patch domain-containing protein n=1 Tax=Mycoemilia scoparia TaxID=417184 RepID=A0A9W7ZSG2_9FUNG|nr:hypothetical protein H4219_004397 [Mycoemilia scoparia]
MCKDTIDSDKKIESSDDDDDDDYMKMDLTLLENKATSKERYAKIPYSKQRQKYLSTQKIKNQNDTMKSAAAGNQGKAREEGLKKVIGEENKGFKMLERMGYKHGKGLGIQEIDKKGLGRKQQESDIAKRQAEHAQTQSKRLKLDFKDRQKNRFEQRRVVSDVYRARKMCRDLDEREGKQRSIFWIPETDITDPHSTIAGEMEKKTMLERIVDDAEETQDNGNNNDSGDSDKEHQDGVVDFESKDADTQLSLLTGYLRSTYHCCLWCGDTYKDDKEMSSHCPGNSYKAHSEL